jgi:hypothetical protein
MQQSQITIKDLKSFLNHIVSNNRQLQEEGKTPVAVEVVGDSGIGKTSSIIQLAQELDLNFVKLNLAQIEELGDLVGFPIRQFEMVKGDEVKMVDENHISEYKELGYKSTGKNQMSYCPPEWISGKEKGGILLLDDWNRADLRFIQAIMELIDRQQYISWTLPKDWHIILTSNPDNGDYIVNSIDNAQKTRFISVNLKFDINCWSEWAEENGIDSRCINFLLMNKELVSKDTNSRSITTFFNSISSIPMFEKELSLIQMIGEGSVGAEFASMFNMFINNKLDKLLSPEKIMLDENEDYVMSALKSSIGEDDKYRADIASTLSTRIINYSLNYSKENKISKEYINRIIKLTTSNLFTNDLKYNIVKKIYNGNPTKFQMLTLNKDVIKFITK